MPSSKSASQLVVRLSKSMLILQADLSRAQEALRVVRTESARRLRDLQQLQGLQASHAPHPALTQQLDAEVAAREAAEAKLREARASLARHKQLVSDLRKRVSACAAGMYRPGVPGRHACENQLQCVLASDRAPPESIVSLIHY